MCLQRYVTYPAEERERMAVMHDVLSFYERWPLKELKMLKHILAVEDENQNDRD